MYLRALRRDLIGATIDTFPTFRAAQAFASRQICGIFGLELDCGAGLVKLQVSQVTYDAMLVRLFAGAQ